MSKVLSEGYVTFVLRTESFDYEYGCEIFETLHVFFSHYPAEQKDVFASTTI